MVECTGLENRRWETVREFESHRLRQILINTGSGTTTPSMPQTQGNQMKKLLVTDVDGVLVNYSEAYRKHWEKKLGRAVVEKDRDAYWNIDRYDVPVLQGEELQDFKDSFRREFWESIEVLDGAVRAYERLCEHYTIVACTTSDPIYNEVRQNHLRSIGFKNIVVHSVGQNSDPSINPKAEIINRLNPIAVVDDLPLGLSQLNTGIYRFLIARNFSDERSPVRLWCDRWNDPDFHRLYFNGSYDSSGLSEVTTHLFKYRDHFGF